MIASTPPDIPQPADAPWRELVLLCGKCLKKRDREALRGDLKRALKQAGHRDVRVATVSCFDLCPKRGIALARGRELATGASQLRVVDDDIDVEALRAWVLRD
ncbi:hypothetical protein [Coralloluteibacterium stylophorae]|uniref:(2Fe-2S) ferredoxin domain-containing protein n=1 Tax=Coralloluteibacterium stylophorae TaxID=1776034 RepID=A0A8J7VS82_9GAMM|nr:hypothetical protein [Coralloluteibacterium stylophorae]MBS7458217.1 hypothetical protein [Coralloluteibacterium stylophorae]